MKKRRGERGGGGEWCARRRDTVVFFGLGIFLLLFLLNWAGIMLGV